MYRKLLVIAVALIAALSISACGNNGGASHFKTDSLKEYVQKSKKNSKWTPEKRKKAMGEIFSKGEK